MLITRISGATGKIHTLDIPVNESKYYKWANGDMKGHIQNIFPELSDAQREFLLTGITGEEWDAIFADDDEDED